MGEKKPKWKPLPGPQTELMKRPVGKFLLYGGVLGRRAYPIMRPAKTATTQDGEEGR